MKRLGLARAPKDALFAAVAEAGWEPVNCPFTTFEPTEEDNPCPKADLAIVLSPAAARAASLDPALPCLATGEATAAPLRNGLRSLHLPETPDAEGLWKALQTILPDGGKILLVRGERSRAFLEHVAADSPWQLHAWITHREVPASPFPDLTRLDAVLALGPLQAELLAVHARHLPRFAWGARTADAFARCGAPAVDWCEPRPAALKAMLERPW